MMLIEIAGGAGENIEASYDLGVASIFTINKLPEDFQISRNKSAENLEFTVDNILRLIKNFKNVNKNFNKQQEEA